MRTPFEVRFVSDAFEFAAESKANQRGFRLDYILVPCPEATGIDSG